MTYTETRIRAELADLIHQAGRMTKADPRYAPLHKKIATALDRLLSLPRSVDSTQ